MNTEKLSFSGIISPRNPFEFILFGILSIVLNIIASLISLKGVLTLIPIFCIIILFFGWWWYDKQRSKKLLLLFSVEPKKEEPSPAHGLILLLSPYDPRFTQKEKAPLMDLDALVTVPDNQLDDEFFRTINFFDSNLKPQLQAIEFHYQNQTLKDIWLITSRKPQSITTAELLKKYLLFKYEKHVNVHTNLGNNPLTAEEWDYLGIWKLGDDIYRQSDYKDKAIVADITGGNKMMSVALALACIPPKRRLQYMEAERDSQGTPERGKPLVPILIDIDPIMYVD